jgi:glutamate carboxypeptidase
VTAFLSACARESDRLLQSIRDLVSCESPSDDPALLEACAAVFAAQLADAGARIDRRTAGPGTAAHLIGTWPGEGPRVLLLGHVDTVWPLGQIQRQPLETREGKMFGPGIFDMKAGLAIATTAVRVVTSLVPAASRPATTFLATTDEEIGSGSSRALIEELARESAFVLVIEPALPGGAIKTARKGVGEYEIVATGIASHAGVDPGAGASAVHEIAHVINAVVALSDPQSGLTVNAGVVHGGTRPNVVAESARVLVDVRVSRMADVARIESGLRGLRARDSRVTLTVTGGVNRPPMERTAGVERLYLVARDVARDQGWELTEGSTGGGSDGNFCAALGVPTLDGLGAVGDGAHALHEHVVIKELVPRAALLAGLLERLASDKAIIGRT